MTNNIKKIKYGIKGILKRTKAAKLDVDKPMPMDNINDKSRANNKNMLSDMVLSVFLIPTLINKYKDKNRIIKFSIPDIAIAKECASHKYGRYNPAIIADGINATAPATSVYPPMSNDSPS